MNLELYIEDECKYIALRSLKEQDQKVFSFSIGENNICFKANRFFSKFHRGGERFYVSIDWIRLNGKLIKRN